MTTAVVGADGQFPYRGDYFVVSVLLLTTAGLLVANRVVRIGVVIAVLASVVVFAVPNPLGGNLVRLTQFVAVPVALLGVGTVRRRVRPAAAALLLAATAWSASFGVVAALDGTGDPSTHRDYHQPLIDEVRRPQRRRPTARARRDPLHREPLGELLRRPGAALRPRLGAPDRPRAQQGPLRPRAGRRDVPPVAARQRRALDRAARRGARRGGPAGGRASRASGVVRLAGAGVARRPLAAVRGARLRTDRRRCRQRSSPRTSTRS